MVYYIACLLLIILLILSLLKNRNAIGLFVFINLFLPQEISVFNFFGLTAYRLSYIIFSIYVILTLKYTKKYELKWIYIIIAITFFIPYSNSPANESNALFGYILYYLPNYLLPSLLVYYSINNRQDQNSVYLWMKFTILIWGIYALLEYVTKTNFFIDSLKIEFPKTTEYVTEGYKYDEGIGGRYGSISRLQCTVWHPIAFGLRINLILAYLMYYNLNSTILNKKNNLRQNIITYYPYVIISLMSIATFSRSIWIQTILCFAFFINFKIQNSKIRNSIILISILVSLLFINQIFDIVNNSFFSNIEGSSIDMRLNQFEKVLELTKGSTIFGNGIGFISNYLNRLSGQTEAFGFESIIFITLAETGIIGIIVYILLFITINRSLKSNLRMKIGSNNILILPFLIAIIITGELQNIHIFLLLSNILITTKIYY